MPDRFVLGVEQLYSLLAVLLFEAVLLLVFDVLPVLGATAISAGVHPRSVHAFFLGEKRINDPELIR